MMMNNIINLENPQNELFKIESNNDEKDINKQTWKNTLTGLISEKWFELICLYKQWEYGKTENNIAPYDYIVKLNHEWKKVQVKSIYTCQNKNNCMSVNIFRQERGKKIHTIKYKKEDFDLLFATDSKIHYLIPFHKIENKFSISFKKGEYDSFEIKI